METSATDKLFAGSIPKIYETYLVPLLFEPYAADLVKRVAPRAPRSALEIAAGTGVVTRALAAALPDGVAIVATDLNQAMLDQAAALGTERPVEWRQADAMQLPFADATFDAVVCQFGVMFFPDKARALAEARRVLRPGGVFVFSVWDRLDTNEVANVAATAVAALFPDDPPRFLARTPYAYHERAAIERDVAAGGFDASPEIATVTERSRARTARDAAIAFCQGTPLRSEIEQRGASRLDEATDAVADAIVGRFGAGAVDARMQAHVVTVGK
jgi:SAM-dependent methyltransferase